MEENAIENFNKMIIKSWTYARLTDTEKQSWQKTLESTRTQEAVKGTYKQRWQILQAIYESFLSALDYKPIGWRELEEIPLF